MWSFDREMELRNIGRTEQLASLIRYWPLGWNAEDQPDFAHIGGEAYLATDHVSRGPERHAEIVGLHHENDAPSR